MKFFYVFIFNARIFFMKIRVKNLIIGFCARITVPRLFV